MHVRDTTGRRARERGVRGGGGGGVCVRWGACGRRRRVVTRPVAGVARTRPHLGLDVPLDGARDLLELPPLVAAAARSVPITMGCRRACRLAAVADEQQLVHVGRAAADGAAPAAQSHGRCAPTAPPATALLPGCPWLAAAAATAVGAAVGAAAVGRHMRRVPSGVQVHKDFAAKGRAAVRALVVVVVVVMAERAAEDSGAAGEGGTRIRCHQRSVVLGTQRSNSEAATREMAIQGGHRRCGS